MKVRLENIKLLEENTGSNLLDIDLGDDIFDSDTKSKNKQVGLYQTKSFRTAKEIINKMKSQLTKWEKIFANHVFDKRLISKIYKELIQLNIKKINNLIEKWAEDLNRHFH